MSIWTGDVTLIEGILIFTRNTCLLWVGSALAGVWTRWPAEVPSNPYQSVWNSVTPFCDSYNYLIIGWQKLTPNFPWTSLFYKIAWFQYFCPGLEHTDGPQWPTPAWPGTSTHRPAASSSGSPISAQPSAAGLCQSHTTGVPVPSPGSSHISCCYLLRSLDEPHPRFITSPCLTIADRPRDLSLSPMRPHSNAAGLHLLVRSPASGLPCAPSSSSFVEMPLPGPGNCNYAKNTLKWNTYMKGQTPGKKNWPLVWPIQEEMKLHI